jgi:hypothetical protein
MMALLKIGKKIINEDKILTADLQENGQLTLVLDGNSTLSFSGEAATALRRYLESQWMDLDKE